MCGIVGVAGDLSHSGRKAFKLLLMLDTIRGPHSTGVVTVKNKDVNIDKYLGTPWDFFPRATERFTKGTPDHGAQILIGHNRYATLGGITADNAHPFNHGNIYGVHNGTLTYSGQKNVDPDNKFGTDSEAIMYQLDKIGLVETYKKLIGAWALVWYDKSEKRVNFIRNKERPLYYAISEDGKMLFWASEDWMIDQACYTHGIKLREILQFEEDIPYKTRWSKKDGIGLIEGKEPLEKGKPPSYSYSSRYSGGGSSNNGAFFRGKNTSGGKTSPHDMDAIRKAYNKYSGKWIRFYMAPNSDTKVSYGGFSLTSWDDDIFEIRVPHTRSKADNAADVEKFFAHDWNNWYYGLVRFVSSSEGELQIVLDIDSISEPLPWEDFSHKQEGALSFKEFKSKNLNSISEYLDIVGIDTAIEGGNLKHEEYVGDIEEESTTVRFGETLVVRDMASAILDKGCAYCSVQENMSNVGHCTLLQDHSFLCQQCSNDTEIKDLSGPAAYS